MCDIDSERRCIVDSFKEHRCLDCATGEEWNAASAKAREIVWPATMRDSQEFSYDYDGPIPMG